MGIDPVLEAVGGARLSRPCWSSRPSWRLLFADDYTDTGPGRDLHRHPTNDAGAGSLAERSARQRQRGCRHDRFLDAGGGPHTIAVTTPLPDITGPVTLDATSEALGGGAPGIVVDGTAAGNVHGLTLTSGAGGSEDPRSAHRQIRQHRHRPERPVRRDDRRQLHRHRRDGRPGQRLYGIRSSRVRRGTRSAATSSPARPGAQRRRLPPRRLRHHRRQQRRVRQHDRREPDRDQRCRHGGDRQRRLRHLHLVALQRRSAGRAPPIGT